MIMLTLVLQSVGLPVEGIAIVLGVDRLLDMSRTATNITGGCLCGGGCCQRGRKKTAKKRGSAA
ncbi:MAG: cation:dicarboxylate symporter family transporter [Thermoactinomyces vulgaris]